MFIWREHFIANCFAVHFDENLDNLKIFRQIGHRISDKFTKARTIF